MSLAPPRLALPGLHVVTTREILERPRFLEEALAVLDASRAALHLRAWGSSGRLLLETARRLREARPNAVLVVNDRVDVARIAGAGAHLPEAGLTPAQARTILGEGSLLGRSVHDESLTGSRPNGERLLDYVFYGHVYETAAKAGRPPRGLAGLSRAIPVLSGLPILAIGGVTLERVAELVAAGAHGVAVVGSVWDAPDPAAAAARFAEELTRLERPSP